MVRSVKVLGLVALVAVTALFVSPANAQSPTANADNSHEYNAYVYGYIAMVYSGSLENATYNDWQSANSNLNGFYSQWFWADETSNLAAAGFNKCYKCLTQDTDTLWDDAADDFEDAINTCEVLLMVMESNGASSSRIQSAESILLYLEIAKDAADDAFAASNQKQRLPFPGFPGGR